MRRSPGNDSRRGPNVEIVGTTNGVATPNRITTHPGEVLSGEAKRRIAA